MNYFPAHELQCNCGCGTNEFSPHTLERLNNLRRTYGKPIILNSAYRCPEYNTKMGYTQTHASGQAVDIRIQRKDAMKLLPLIFRAGFTGLGINQKGNTRFIHIDDLPEILPKQPRPHIWSYS